MQVVFPVQYTPNVMGRDRGRGTTCPVGLDEVSLARTAWGRVPQSGSVPKGMVWLAVPKRKLDHYRKRDSHFAGLRTLYRPYQLDLPPIRTESLGARSQELPARLPSSTPSGTKRPAHYLHPHGRLPDGHRHAEVRFTGTKADKS